jgi:hypothetical protein
MDYINRIVILGDFMLQSDMAKYQTRQGLLIEGTVKKLCKKTYTSIREEIDAIKEVIGRNLSTCVNGFRRVNI